MGYEDFLIAAINLGCTLCDHVDELRVGELVYRAVKSTYMETGVNVNLGIVLLLVPLAKACWQMEEGGKLRSSVRRVLDSLSVDDAAWVYRAIRMVSPGGIGESDRAGIRRDPDITLKEAMFIASGKDSIAYEYVSGYERSFELVYPLINRFREEGLSWEDSIVEAYLNLLAEVPDTLIARKYGMEVAKEVSKRAAEILMLGGVRTQRGKEAIKKFDEDLRGGSKKLNPGTSADLITSGLMIYLLKNKGGISA